MMINIYMIDIFVIIVVKADGKPVRYLEFVARDIKRGKKRSSDRIVRVSPFCDA